MQYCIKAYCSYYFIVCFSYLEEAAMPLDQYVTMRQFFVRTLKEGLRPIDQDPCCLVTGNQLVAYLVYYVYDSPLSMCISCIFCVYCFLNAIDESCV